MSIAIDGPLMAVEWTRMLPIAVNSSGQDRMKIVLPAIHVRAQVEELTLRVPQGCRMLVDCSATLGLSVNLVPGPGVQGEWSHTWSSMAFVGDPASILWDGSDFGPHGTVLTTSSVVERIEIRNAAAGLRREGSSLGGLTDTQKRKGVSRQDRPGLLQIAKQLTLHDAELLGWPPEGWVAEAKTQGVCHFAGAADALEVDGTCEIDTPVLLPRLRVSDGSRVTAKAPLDLVCTAGSVIAAQSQALRQVFGNGPNAEIDAVGGEVSISDQLSSVALVNGSFKLGRDDAFCDISDVRLDDASVATLGPAEYSGLSASVSSSIDFGPESTAHGVRFDGTTCSIGDYSSVTAIGSVVVHGCSGTLMRAADSKDLLELADGSKDLTGEFLEIAVDDSARGATRTLLHLGEATLVEFDPRSLLAVPVTPNKFAESRFARHACATAVHTRAEIASMKSVNATGRLRAMSQSRAVRSHQASGFERLTLTLFRGVGFGLKPLPPLFAWVAASAAVGAVSARGSGLRFSLTNVDASATASQFVAALLMPLRLITRADTTTLAIDGSWLVIAQFAVSIPFAAIVASLTFLARSSRQA